MIFYLIPANVYEQFSYGYLSLSLPFFLFNLFLFYLPLFGVLANLSSKETVFHFVNHARGTSATAKVRASSKSQTLLWSTKKEEVHTSEL